MSHKSLFILAILTLLSTEAAAGTLTAVEAEQLRAGVATMMPAYERGDADAIIRRTHSSVIKLSGGQEAFESMIRSAIVQLRQTGMKVLSEETGLSTRTYAAGDEEVCFVPRITVIKLAEKTMRSTTFMIGVRRLGAKDWKYIDGSGLRKHPELLYQLLPKLERNIKLPENKIEAL